MGFVPGYENDIFISYAHNDNLPIYSVRWAERFHDNLENRLTELLGKRPVIWRDKRLGAADQVNGQLDARINTSAIMLAIISPSYFESTWCGWEREKFIESANRRSGLIVENKSRIVKVVKTFVEFATYPDEFKETLGRTFLSEDKAAGKYYEFETDSAEYKKELEELAQSLAGLMKLLHKRALTLIVAADKTIYLAETSSDLENERDTIKRAFADRYQILPLEELSPRLPAADLKKEILDSLYKTKLSVHLIGAGHVFIPQDLKEERSIIQLQHDAAQEHAATAAFKQIIWIPKGLENGPETTDKQKDFISALLVDSAAQKQADVLRGDLEELKTRIDELMKPPPDPVVSLKGNGSLASVYLICDNRDRKEALAVEDALYGHGCEVLPPLPKGSKAQFVEYHNENLRICDAFLVYFNRANENWALMKKQDFVKLPGLRLANPVLAKAFCITGEKTPPKERFQSPGAVVIKHFDQFMPHILQPFLDEIRKAKGQGGAK